MTMHNHIPASVREHLARLEADFDRLARIRFSAPWRTPGNCGR